MVGFEGDWRDPGSLNLIRLFFVCLCLIYFHKRLVQVRSTYGYCIQLRWTVIFEDIAVDPIVS